MPVTPKKVVMQDGAKNQTPPTSKKGKGKGAKKAVLLKALLQDVATRN